MDIGCRGASSGRRSSRVATSHSQIVPSSRRSPGSPRRARRPRATKQARSAERLRGADRSPGPTGSRGCRPGSGRGWRGRDHACARTPRTGVLRPGPRAAVVPAGGHVPPLDRAVGTPRRQGLAVGCEGQRLDAARVPREDVSLRSGAGDVPELDRPVITPRRQRPPAVQERDGPHEVRVALQRRPGLAGLDDPQPDRVRVRRREISAVRREGHPRAEVSG